MRPIPKGYQAVFEVEVTPEMTVDFEELGRVHPVYATYWMAKHMELASRKIILPFLEYGEDGIGFEVTVRHLAPALPGMRLRVVARHLGTEGNRVLAGCTVKNEQGDRIGEGETVQVILPKAKIQAIFDRVRERFEEASRGRGTPS